MAILRSLRSSPTLICALVVLLTGGGGGLSPALAQDAGDVDAIQQQIEQVREQQVTSVKSNDELLKEPLGVVQEVEITGLPTVRDSVVRRQLSFNIGDSYTEWHHWRSVVLLHELGLFWRVEISYEVIGDKPTPAIDLSEADDAAQDEVVSNVDGDPEAPVSDAASTGADTTIESAAEGASIAIDPNRPLRIKVAVFEGKSYYFYPYGFAEAPYIFGAVVGDRDVLQTGSNMSFALFAIDDLEYYALTYEDPQFLGGHRRASFTAQLSDSAITIRDERNPSTGDSYYLGKDGFSFRYNSTYMADYRTFWGVEAYQIETDPRSGTLVGGTKKFLFSGTEIPDGTLTYLNAGIRRSRIRGYPLTNEGYSWSFETNQSLEALGSLENFGRYKFNASGFIPIGEGHAFGAGVRFDTSHGDIPHYEAPLAGPFIRGYTGNDFYSRSALTINTEFRYMVDPELGQIVAFFDAGKGFDSAMPSFKDLEYGYGLGIRARTLKFLPMDLVIYADYAWGPDDTEIAVGIGQWF